MSHTEAAETAHIKIEVTALGDRRTVEAIYLELRELAKQHHLKIEYRLTRSAPEDASEEQAPAS